MTENRPSGKTSTYDLDALLSGDHAAFEQLVIEESTRLFRVLIRILRNEEDARSVVQETFLLAYQRLGTFRGESKFTTWLYSIGIYQARSLLRSKQRVVVLEEEEIDRLQPQFRLGRYRDRYEPWQPDAISEKAERIRLVRDAIEKLPETYRVIITLRDIEELSSDEVAQILGISNGAVRIRLHRARQALRALLDPYFGG